MADRYLVADGVVEHACRPVAQMSAGEAHADVIAVDDTCPHNGQGGARERPWAPSFTATTNSRTDHDPWL